MCTGDRTCILGIASCFGESNCVEKDVVYTACDTWDSEICMFDTDCHGDRYCVNNSCAGDANC